MEHPGFYVSFTLRRSLDRLNVEQKGLLFAAMFDYAQFGLVPDFSDPFLMLMWDFIQPRLDTDAEKYYATVTQKRRNSFGKAWAVYAETNGIDPNDLEAKEAWIDTKMEQKFGSDNKQPLPTAADSKRSLAIGENYSDSINRTSTSALSETTTTAENGGVGEKTKPLSKNQPLAENSADDFEEKRRRAFEKMQKEWGNI